MPCLPIAKTAVNNSAAYLGTKADLGLEYADTFRYDSHRDFRADFVLSNSPVNDSAFARSSTLCMDGIQSRLVMKVTIRS